MKNSTQKILAFVAIASPMILPELALAASQFNTTAAATMTTDITDTLGAGLTWAFGLATVTMAGWYGFNIFRKVGGKLGAR